MFTQIISQPIEKLRKLQEWIKSLAIFAYVLVFGINFLNLSGLNWCYTHHIVWTYGLLLVLIYGSLLALTMLQQPRGGGSFSEGVLHLRGQELVTAWNQRTGSKVAVDGETWWLLLWKLTYFGWNIKNKENKLAKFCPHPSIYIFYCMCVFVVREREREKKKVVPIVQ